MLQQMAGNAPHRQPTASTFALPNFKSQSTNTNLPPSLTSSRLARPLNTSRTNSISSSARDKSVSGSTGGTARRVSQPSNNRALETSTGGSVTASSAARPRRILQSVQENAQSPNDEIGSSREQRKSGNDGARSIRPPSATSLYPPSTVSSTSATPLRQSQLSRSTSSRAGLTVPESPSTVRPKDRRLGTTKPLESSVSTTRSGPRLSATATTRRILSGSSLRPVASQEGSTDSPRRGKDRVPSTSSSPRKPSLNRSTSSSSTLRRSTTTANVNRDSPLKRSTTTSRLPNSSSSSSASTLMRPPSSTSTLPRATARRIPLPATSSSSANSSIPIFSSSSSTAGATTTSTSIKEPRNRLGLGLPPVGGAARRVSVANVRLGGGPAASTRTPSSSRGGGRGGTPKRSSTLRTSTLGTTSTSKGDQEGQATNRRDSQIRRESWETVGSNNPRSRSTSITSTASTARNRIASDSPSFNESNDAEDATAERKTPFSTPSKSLSTSQTPRFNAVLLSPPRADSTASSLPSAPPENRQLSLLRSSSSATTNNSTPDPSNRRQPRGSTTLEELLQNGLFSSPSLSTQTPLGKTTAGGGGNDFEFLMDEEVSRIMLEEIQSSSAGGIGGGTPWRGRVVSLSMSGSGGARKPRTEGDGGDISFEMDHEGAQNDFDPEEKDEEGGGQREDARVEMGREILVLQRVDEEQLEELRKEKEALAQELDILRRKKREDEERAKREVEERFEAEMEQKRKEWEREKEDFERSLASFESTKGTQLDLSLLRATTAYRASQTGYEHVVTAASREREELFGALEGLKIIARGLEAWEALG
ncbi:hypothetical protein JCM3765_000772 [Sporobolomyces pararoseus]